MSKISASESGVDSGRMLSPKRVAGIRLIVDSLDDIMYSRDRHDLLEIIDTYEATRPKPASEPPKAGEDVMILRRIPAAARPLWVTGAFYGEKGWYSDIDGPISEKGVLAWLPLPKLPVES